MLYVCEVENCKNRTRGNLCDKHIAMLRKGCDAIMCEKCGVIVEVKENYIEGKPGKVDLIPECYVCKGRKRKVKYPWEKI